MLKFLLTIICICPLISSENTNLKFLETSELILGGLRNQNPVPGLGYTGNPEGMDKQKFIENIEIPQEVLNCSDQKYSPNNDAWTFNQIAEAFYEYGIKPWNVPNPNDRSKHIEECVAALVIVSGECSPANNGCSASRTGESGVFQTDFLRTIPGFPSKPIMNLCTSAFGAGYMIAPWLVDDKRTCTISMINGSPASMYNCYLAKSNLSDYGDACKDPQAVSGQNYNNFIGPFCHRSGASRWSQCSSCCALFNGGGNSYQPPYPNYYFEKAWEQNGENFDAICRTVASNN